ncbi:hypothetical protein O5833_26945, partial [Escherichia coli]|nr:hypothetical protein [Escherichia coli]
QVTQPQNSPGADALPVLVKHTPGAQRFRIEGISDPNDPKWVEGIQTRDSVYQNQQEMEQNLAQRALVLSSAKACAMRGA